LVTFATGQFSWSSTGVETSADVKPTYKQNSFGKGSKK